MVRFFSIAILLACCPASFGAIVTLSTSDSPIGARTANQGWWSDLDTNTATGTGVQTGSVDFGGVFGDFRSFFTFDLDSPALVGSTVDSFRLQVQRGTLGTNDAIETLELFSVGTAAATLNATGGPNATIFGDLGSGTSYGTFDISAGAASDVLEFNLNGAAVAELQAAIGGGGSPNYFSIGAVLTTSDGFDDIVFGGVVPAAGLSITTAVPEPSSAALISLSLIGAGFLRRRRA